MFEWLEWFTHLDNSKIFSLLLFFTTFCGIVIYVFTGRKRGRRLESYKYIPFQDEDRDRASRDDTSPDETPTDASSTHASKVKDNDRKNQ